MRYYGSTVRRSVDDCAEKMLNEHGLWHNPGLFPTARGFVGKAPGLMSGNQAFRLLTDGVFRKCEIIQGDLAREMAPAERMRLAAASGCRLAELLVQRIDESDNPGREEEIVAEKMGILVTKCRFKVALSAQRIAYRSS